MDEIKFDIFYGMCCEGIFSKNQPSLGQSNRRESMEVLYGKIIADSAIPEACPRLVNNCAAVMCKNLTA